LKKKQILRKFHRTLIISLQQQILPVCQNDLMTSYQHYVTSEQYVSISQMAIIVYELANKISRKSA